MLTDYSPCSPTQGNPYNGEKVTARRLALLRLLVEEYIRTKAPVPSARLAEALGLSPALVRYELIALEEEGYLTKPHASAGRVPTRQGFRQYTLALLPPKPLPEAVQERVERALEEAREPEALLVKMAVGLSGYPARLRLVPRRTPTVRQVHLSPLPEGTLAVLVLEGGRVQEARLSLRLPPQELRRAEEALAHPFTQLPPAPKGLEGLFAALETALRGSREVIYREGLALALREPEAQNPGLLERLVRLYEAGGEEVLTPASRVDVMVGEVEGLSTVRAGFARGEWLGEITLIGPLRMRYPEALSVAYSLGQLYTGRHAG